MSACRPLPRTAAALAVLCVASMLAQPASSAPRGRATTTTPDAVSSGAPTSGVSTDSTASAGGTSTRLEVTTPSAADREDLRPPLALSLQQAVEMAILHDLDVRGARLTTRSADGSVLSARGFTDPAFNALYEHDKNVSPQASVLSSSESSRDIYQASIGQTLWYGGSYQVGLTANKNETDNTFSLFPTSNTSDLLLKYTQPLLRGLGRAANRRILDQAINNATISRRQLEVRARDVVRDTVRAYWELVFAIRNRDVGRASLGLARELLRKNRIMVDVGTLAPLEISQAEASVASREFGIITADTAIGNAEDALHRLMGVEDGSPWWGMRIVPTDEAEFHAAFVDLDEQLATALARRSELDVAQLAIENARIAVKGAHRDLLPRLDLSVSTTSAGLSQSLTPDPDPLVDSNGDGDPTNDVSVSGDGFGSSLDQVFRNEFNSYTAAISYVQPIFNRAARGAYIVQRVGLEERKLDLERARQTVTLEARSAVRLLDSARERIASASAARTLQQKTLDAEIKKFENGLSTNFEVLTFQTNLQTAESDELRALTDYLQALAELKRARGTLLQDYGLTLTE